VVMFVVIALMFLPMPFMDGDLAKVMAVYNSSAAITLSLVLMVLCTLIAYTMMNVWQPHVSATQAGLIYCAEPVFTMLFALFLPGWFSALATINYPNEGFTTRQLLGGGLITAANILILVQAARLARNTAGAKAS